MAFIRTLLLSCFVVALLPWLSDAVVDPPITEQQEAFVNTWYEELFVFFRQRAYSPGGSTRVLSMLSVSQLQAALQVRERLGYQPDFLTAAAIGAGHTIASYFFNDQQEIFDRLLQSQLVQLPLCGSVNDSLALGISAANKMVQDRVNDGSHVYYPYWPPTEPRCGIWTETSHHFAWGPNWHLVQPFVLMNAQMFRPPGPPPIDSERFKHDYEEVRRLGGKNSTERTAEQTHIAQYWDDAPGSFTPPAHWIVITRTVMQSPPFAEMSFIDKLRIYAVLNVALFDTGLAVWDAKYHYNHWRPVTAIHNIDSCGDKAKGLVKDESWESLLYTPDFPDYTSGHSTFSAAAAVVLSNLLCTDHANFTVKSEVNTTRSFTSFTQAAEEAGRSRIYGGIHFESASHDGAETGRGIGAYVLAHFYPQSNATGCSFHYDLPEAPTLDFGCNSQPESSNQVPSCNQVPN